MKVKDLLNKLKYIDPNLDIIVYLSDLDEIPAFPLEDEQINDKMEVLSIYINTR